MRASHHTRRLVSHAAGCGVLLVLGSASGAGATFMTGRFENETYFNPGLLLGASLRDGHVMGAVGAEVSVHHFLKTGLGVGGFGQWQWEDSSHHRWCGGAQVTSPTLGYGAEVGVAYATPDARFAGTLSVHLAPFLSFGVATLSLRVGIPVYHPAISLPGRGFEGGLSLALKLPIYLNSVPPPPPRSEGRPSPERK